LSARRRYGDAIPTAAFLSFRLGGSDGVAVEARKWQGALAALGFDTFTVAGDGNVDRLLPGLAMGSDQAPSAHELTDALDRADLVVVENLCSLPLNPGAAAVTAAVLRGRPAVLHHHDLPWQRPQFAAHPPPPVDPRWCHVTINALSRGQLADRGIGSTTVYNSFALHPGEDDGRDDASDQPDRRLEIRRSLGVGRADRLVLQPTRAIPRKNVGGGIGVATTLGATYWLLGPAEDGFDAELEELVAAARCPVVRGIPDGVGAMSVTDAYRACDVVTLPSTWEGFGNPSIESVLHRRPLAIGPYPVAAELAAFGFEWFALDQVDRLGRWLDAPEPGLLDRNMEVASAHFSLRDLPVRIAAVLPDL
jgi:glycosyltransferase involved in cell wall biosynthesis